MTTKTVAIVIPTHSPTISSKEELALTLLKKFCSQFDWYLVHPMGLSFQYDTSDFIKMPLSKRHFSSYQNYNRLCMNPRFYARFQQYEYILICQLDAYILKDELLNWCEKGYSYNGSPLFYKTWLQRHFLGKKLKSILKRLPYIKHHLRLHTLQVGCGGLSLRHVQDAIAVLHSNHFYFSQKKYCRKKIVLAKAVLYSLLHRHRIKADILRRICLNEQEDFFWMYYAKFLYKPFTFASNKEGNLFAFDSSYEKRLKLNGHQAPFGIHQNIDKHTITCFIDTLKLANITEHNALLDKIREEVCQPCQKSDLKMQT